MGHVTKFSKYSCGILNKAASSVTTGCINNAISKMGWHKIKARLCSDKREHARSLLGLHKLVRRINANRRPPDLHVDGRTSWPG